AEPDVHGPALPLPRRAHVGRARPDDDGVRVTSPEKNRLLQGVAHMPFIVLAVVLLAAAAYMLGEAITAPARERQVSVKRASTYGKFRATLGEQEQPFRERVVEPAKTKLAGLVFKVHPKTTLDSVRSKLLAAGMGRTVTPTGFLAAKGGFAIGGFILGAIFGGALASGPGLLVFGVALGGIGFIGPDFVAGTRARKRRDAIKAQLPDALDLLAVSVEAGLGFDGAISKLTDKMEGPLTEEFGLTLNEIRIGE